MKVVVLTTSYPREADDVAGTFVRDAVEGVRALGVEVEVVSPASFRHYGIAYGHGIPGNIRRRPWLVLALPFFLLGFAREARRAARDADVVHAHWLPSALPALATRRPMVLQLWGTDVEIARRTRWLSRALVSRARLVLAGAPTLADAAREFGAREVRLVPPGVDAPARVAAPEEPPHVLFAGRLSEEKGIREFAEATTGLRRVIVGDGPLRDELPEALGAVPHSDIGRHYAAAAVVCVPSRREGVGFVAREAMAHGRPVVATRVGGLADAIEDGVCGILVDPGDIAELRAAIERLLGDAELRTKLGEAARERAIESFSPTTSARAVLSAYRDAAG